MFGVDGLKASNPKFHTMGDGSMIQLNGKNFQGAHDSELNLVNSIGLLMMLCAPHPADRVAAAVLTPVWCLSARAGSCSLRCSRSGGGRNRMAVVAARR